MAQFSKRDVRMRGFARRTTVEAAWAWLDARTAPLPAEMVALCEAAGRVLAAGVSSDVDVPPFARAMMDGFAVRAADTLGASEYNRLTLMTVGEALPGRRFEGAIQKGQAVRIMTGAPLPPGADAVLPAEQVEEHDSRVEVQGEVAPGKHVGQVGEDVARGDMTLPAGRRLRPQDLGVLSSIGVSQVSAVRRPVVRIVITGNELLPPGARPTGFCIPDANGPMLDALVRRDGGFPKSSGLVPDVAEMILTALRDDCDLVLVSGGSSVGKEDLTAQLLAQYGDLSIHGIAMRPSSPAGMGALDRRLVFLLPGNPVSCLCAYDFFAGRAIRALGGRSREWPYPSMRLPLRRKLASVVGRVDYARVKLVDEGIEPLAIGGASVLSSTTRADGFVIVPSDSEGYPPGATVEAFLYDERPH